MLRMLWLVRRRNGNVTLILFPYSPELNPQERVWLFLRGRHLSNRLLCHAWAQAA